MERREGVAWLALALAATAGVAAVLAITPHGPGLSPDSVHYNAGARNIFAGHGYAYRGGDGAYRPIANWPPLYSVVLALPALVGVDPLRGARVVDALLFGLMLLMVGRAVHRRSSGSLAAALFAMLALLSLKSVLNMYVVVRSESLFVALEVCALVLLADHMERPAWWRLLAASLASGAAFMTRYPAVGLVGAGAIGLLLWRKGGRWRGLRDGAAFGAIACLPAFLWLTRNVETSGTSTGRRLAPNLVDWPHLHEGLQTLWSWLVPTGVGPGVRALAACGLLAGAVTYGVLLFRRRRGAPGDETACGRPARLLPVMLLFVAAYVGGLLAAMTFVRPSCDLGVRYLFPTLPALVVVVTCGACDRLRAAGRPPAARALFIALCVLYIGVNLLQTVPWAARTRRSGMGFLSRSWRDSPIMARLAGLPPGVPIYSNRGEAVYILTGRSTYGLPHSDGSKGAGKELSAMRRGLQQDGGVVAFFARVERPYLLSQEQLEAALPLRAVVRSDEGALYEWGGPPVPRRMEPDSAHPG